MTTKCLIGVVLAEGVIVAAYATDDNGALDKIVNGIAI
jgi:hypothetical protein